jgi:hypothetical protein
MILSLISRRYRGSGFVPVERSKRSVWYRMVVLVGWTAVPTAKAAENENAICSMIVGEDPETYFRSDINGDRLERRALDQLVGRNSTSIPGLYVSCQRTLTS